jgi:hypothetical protein
MITPENRKTRPQHPGKPLLLEDDDDDDDDKETDSPIPNVDMNDATTGTVRSSNTTSSLGSRSMMSAANAENFARLWSKLKESGWKAHRGGPLEDWIYCKPGIKPNRNVEAQENVDYFKTPQALMDYFKNKHSKKLFDAAASNQEREEEEQDEAEEEELQEESNPTQKCKPKESKKKLKPKEQQPTKKRKLVATAAKLAAAKKQKNTSKKATTGKAATKGATAEADPHWWKTTPVPSSHHVWPILEQLKFSRDTSGYYHLPGKDLYNALAFCSLQGLRTFLCLYGIPGSNNGDGAALASDNAETLERWIKFANVPVTKRDSVAVLQNVSSPKDDAALKRLLCELGCSTFDNKLHLPISDLFRFQRRMNIHYFDLENVESRKQARIAVRGQLWTFAEKNTVKVEQLLQVALWSATSSSHDLPVFVGLPETHNAPHDPVHKYNKGLLDKLADLPALVSNPDDEELVEQALEEEEESSLEESSPESQSDDEDEQVAASEEEPDDEEMSTEEEQDDEMSVDAEDDDDDSQESPVVKVVKRRPKAIPTNGKYSSKQAKNPKRPSAIVSQTTTKVKKQQQPATKKKQNQSKEPWWKTQPMPTSRSMRHFLARLGCTIDSKRRRYHLPAELCDAKSFGSIQALRLFLCQFGIPNIKSSSLSQKEKTQLINWVKFASVPVDAKNSVEMLAAVHPPTNTDIVKLLCQHGWSTMDDILYIPGHSHDAKSREKGFDFFDLDQVETHVRLQVRGKLWTYRYAERRHEQRHLQLALWAATAAGDLPTFTVMPEEDELKDFDDLSDIEHSGDSESESGDMSMTTELLRKAQPESESNDLSKKSKAKSAVEAVGASTVGHVPKSKKEKKAKKDPRPFFIREPIPLLDQVWSTLEILGFKRNANAFSHPQIPDRTFSNESSLRAFLVKERIEGLAIKRDDLNQADQEKLDHWVKWTHVPGLTPQSSVQKMQDYKDPSTSAIHQWLVKIHVKPLGGDYHFPTSDKNRQDRREGIHYVNGLDAVRVHIRERSKGDLEKDDGLDLSALGSKELFLLRSWAASSEAPLPIFSKPKHAADSRKARSMRASLHMETRESDATAAPSISTRDDANDVASQQDEVDTHQSPQQQHSSPATAAPSPSTSKHDVEAKQVGRLEGPVQQITASIATSPPDANSHHHSLPLPAQESEIQEEGEKARSSDLSTLQEELDETENDDSILHDMAGDTGFAASSPVMLLTQPGGDEQENDDEQEDDESSFRSLTSRIKDYSSNLVSSFFSTSKASAQKPASASSPTSPGTALFNNNSNSKGPAAALATDADQHDKIAVLTYNTLKNNRGSSAKARSTATETHQQENRTAASLDNDDEMEEWNDTNPFTQ